MLAILVGLAAGVMIYALAFQLTFSQRRFINVKGADKIYAPLSGLETTQELAARPVTGIMIENSPDARPQSSLSQAGVVFEAVAEGGITRFLALYQETRPNVIGPVRSLRIYYLDWAMGFQAPVLHVGGSAEALGFVRDRGARDLDQFSNSSLTYRTGDREAPHNAYSNFDRIDAANSEKGYTSSSFSPYKRKKDAPSAAPTSTSIVVNYSGALYQAEFRYDAPSNSYLRFIAGTSDVDRENNQQLAPKNLVVLDMPTTHNNGYAVMPSIGSGSGTVYLDGISIPVTWNKANYDTMIELKDADGNPITLNRGQTWFAIQPI